MALTKVFEAVFDNTTDVAKWYYTPNSIGANIGSLRLATDGVDDYIETEFGTPPGDNLFDTTAPGTGSDHKGFMTHAAMLADLTPAAGTTGYCFDEDPAKHGRYIKTGATGTGSWGSRVGNVQDKAWPDPNHKRTAWLELILQSWSAAADPGMPVGKGGFPDEPDLRGGEFVYEMRAKDLVLGPHAKIVHHFQTDVAQQQGDWDPATQRPFVNAIQIANPISDQLFFGDGGYYAQNAVKGVHDSGWVRVTVPLRTVATDWVQLGAIEGRNGLTGEPVRYFNYVVSPPSVFLANWTGNAYMVVAHKVVDEATKATPPDDDTRITGTIQTRKFELWLP